MQFKEVGTIGKGRVLVKCGVVGVRRVVTLTTDKREHILSLNVTAARELITHLRSSIRELGRLGIDEPVAKVKPKKREARDE